MVISVEELIQGMTQALIASVRRNVDNIRELAGNLKKLRGGLKEKSGHFKITM